ncbi:MAG: hypothetical protein OXI91_06035 [Chloroflexota bacterium]|nr:hypothetical protein [Chloroflexota bacterium]
MARNQCNSLDAMRLFPLEIQAFGILFLEAQKQRQEADYDPFATFSASDVTDFIGRVETIIEDFNSSDREQRRAFAIHVLFRQRI